MINFDSVKDREKALLDLKSLLEHPGWLLVVEIAEHNINKFKDQIITGFADESVESINRMRDLVKAYQNVIDTPKKQIEKLKPLENQQEVNYDPYE